MDSANGLAALVMSMYANEPCGICGVDLDMAAVRDSIYTGYRAMPGGRMSRCSHATCWDALSQADRDVIIADAERAKRASQS